jgi:hypothetical protein
MSIIAKGHNKAAVKDWTLMKPLLIKRYSTIKTCTQRAKQFDTLTHKSATSLRAESRKPCNHEKEYSREISNALYIKNTIPIMNCLRVF